MKILNAILKPVFAILLLFAFACETQEKKSISVEDTKEIVRQINMQEDVMEIRNFERINEKIYAAVYEGKITVYSDAALENEATLEDIKMRVTFEDVVTYRDEAGLMADSIVKSMHKAADTRFYRVMERWNFDPDALTYSGKVVSIAPVFKFQYTDLDLPPSAHFWMDINELDNILDERDADAIRHYIFESFEYKLDIYEHL
jgi:hypothetical protein